MSELQFGRRAELVLSRPLLTTGAAYEDVELDLSEMRFRFEVRQSDLETPNHARITVYNLSDSTARAAEREFTRVTLSAGFEGGAQYGIVFQGTIKQTRRGRAMGPENVSPYLEILASDGDIALFSTFVKETLQGNLTKPEAQHRVIREQAGLGEGFVMDLQAVNALSRAKVLFGLATDCFRTLDVTHGGRTSVQKGAAQMVALGKYIPTVAPGQKAVVLNAATGLVGVPEVTQEGVKVRCLLNPNIVIGGAIQINNKDVNDLLLSGDVLYLDQRLETLPGQKPKIPDGDGFYKVLVAEHVGDTRGRDWYTDIIALGATDDGTVVPGAGS